jgi:putative ABC transport system substrate-binding protein
MGGKWLELLKRIAPGVTRVALLFNPATTVPVKFYMSSIEAAASSFAIQASTDPPSAPAKTITSVKSEIPRRGRVRTGSASLSRAASRRPGQSTN